MIVSDERIIPDQPTSSSVSPTRMLKNSSKTILTDTVVDNVKFKKIKLDFCNTEKEHPVASLITEEQHVDLIKNPNKMSNSTEIQDEDSKSRIVNTDYIPKIIENISDKYQINFIDKDLDQISEMTAGNNSEGNYINLMNENPDNISVKIGGNIKENDVDLIDDKPNSVLLDQISEMYIGGNPSEENRLNLMNENLNQIAKTAVVEDGEKINKDSDQIPKATENIGNKYQINLIDNSPDQISEITAGNNSEENHINLMNENPDHISKAAGNIIERNNINLIDGDLDPFFLNIENNGEENYINNLTNENSDQFFLEIMGSSTEDIFVKLINEKPNNVSKTTRNNIEENNINFIDKNSNEVLDATESNSEENDIKNSMIKENLDHISDITGNNSNKNYVNNLINEIPDQIPEITGNYIEENEVNFIGEKFDYILGTIGKNDEKIDVTNLMNENPNQISETTIRNTREENDINLTNENLHQTLETTKNIIENSFDVFDETADGNNNRNNSINDKVEVDDLMKVVCEENIFKQIVFNNTEESRNMVNLENKFLTISQIINNPSNASSNVDECVQTDQNICKSGLSSNNIATTENVDQANGEDIDKNSPLTEMLEVNDGRTKPSVEEVLNMDIENTKIVSDLHSTEINIHQSDVQSTTTADDGIELINDNNENDTDRNVIGVNVDNGSTNNGRVIEFVDKEDNVFDVDENKRFDSILKQCEEINKENFPLLLNFFSRKNLNFEVRPSFFLYLF